MKSPFKFLDSFHFEDKKVFFGRDQEIELLYDLIFKSRLILVYGQSGTGKTSLVQCGLGKKFDDTDWFPFLIRRNDNILDSLKESLAAPIGGKLRKDSIIESVKYIFKNYLRPVYLIFDQLEELFIIGTDEERKAFIQQTKEILDAELPCKIIWVMREEYIAELYHFEKIIPTLFDRRLRVEPMSSTNVKEVITGSCKEFNIELEHPEQNSDQIIDQISGGKSGIPLPYLQVYLDSLWQTDFYRTYPQGWEAEEHPDQEFPALEFTSAEISSLGSIENVLESFLRQQIVKIQIDLTSIHPDTPYDSVRQVLDIFVTEDGTKRPITYFRDEQKKISLSEEWQERVAGFPYQDILQNLEQARILRFSDSQIELAHDSLADLIDRERSSEQRQLNQAKQRISSAYREFQETGEYLSAKQLNSLGEFIPRLALDQELEEFIYDSKVDIHRKEEEKEAQRQREIELLENKAKNQRRYFYLSIGFVGVLMLGILVGLYLWVEAENVREKNKNTLAELIKQEEEARSNIERFNNIRKKNIESDINNLTSRAIEINSKGYQKIGLSILQYADSLLNENKDIEDSLRQPRKEVDSLLSKMTQ